MSKKFTEARIREIALNVDDILNEDICMIGHVGEKCEYCKKEIKDGEIVVFENEGIVFSYDDFTDRMLGIDNNKVTSQMFIYHKNCK